MRIRSTEKRKIITFRLNGREEKFIFKIVKGIKQDYIEIIYPKDMCIFSQDNQTTRLKRKHN